MKKNAKEFRYNVYVLYFQGFSKVTYTNITKVKHGNLSVEWYLFLDSVTELNFYQGRTTRTHYQIIRYKRTLVGSMSILYKLKKYSWCHPC